MGFNCEITLEPNRRWREWGRRTVFNRYASFSARLIDAKFAYLQGINAMLIGRALKYPAVGLEPVVPSFRNAYKPTLGRRHTGTHGMYCAPNGLGCQTNASGSHDDHLACYQGKISRLAFFADEYIGILEYEDGDIFVDLGCGSGQNIRFLAERYPTSAVIGTDMNADALALESECEPSANVQFSVGDMRDAEFLYPANV